MGLAMGQEGSEESGEGATSHSTEPTAPMIYYKKGISSPMKWGDYVKKETATEIRWIKTKSKSFLGLTKKKSLIKFVGRSMAN